MPLAPVGAALNPDEFVVAPHVAILDTFRMTNNDGSFAADITDVFIDKLIAHMQQREADTGDLCPLVIGHTMDGVPETEQPPLVGYARNWHKGVLGSTGRACAFFDAWVFHDKVDLAKQFPRRSAEVWASRYEIDPISLLGATTPARDLGLLKLNREGSLTYSPAGDNPMAFPDDKKKDDKAEPKAEPKKDDGKPAGDPKETGKAKGDAAVQEQILALLGQIAEKLGVGASPVPDGSPAADPTAGAPGAGAEPAAGGKEMNDQEMEALMQELMGGAGGAGAAPTEEPSRAGDKPTQNAGGTCYPNGSAGTVIPEPQAKMSRTEQEMQKRILDLETEVTRGKVRDALVKLARPDVASPDDEALVADLIAMSPETRQRQLERLGKTPKAPGETSFHLNRALDQATVNVGSRKLMTSEESQKFSRMAASSGKSFEQVAAENGFDLFAK